MRSQFAAALNTLHLGSATYGDKLEVTGMEPQAQREPWLRLYGSMRAAGHVVAAHGIKGDDLTEHMQQEGWSPPNHTINC
jgi:hypothetical protein